MKRIPSAYCERTYRSEIINNNLSSYNVTIKESDLFIRSDSVLTDLAHQRVQQYRYAIETYITVHPDFLTSLVPFPDDNLAPPIVRRMLTATALASVGPMAAVAGAIAEFVGADLLCHSRNVIVENGGDIFIAAEQDVNVGVFAGSSPLNGHIFLKIKREEMPMGICTSSGTVGHSLSFGKADAVCIKAKSAALADAAATAIANRVKRKQDIHPALEIAMGIEQVMGALIVLEDQLGAVGDMELCKP
jgi:ApbE superfamily uncharacterized protein (UPF0280 family)